MANGKLKLIETTRSKLDQLTITDGQLIYLTDTNQLYRDTSNERRNLVTDFIIKNTDAEITGLLAPLDNKFYFSNESGIIYKSIDGTLTPLNKPDYATDDEIIALFNN